MISLHKKYGTYAAVAREVGRSGSTVSKYVQLKGLPQNVILAVEKLINSQREV